jgi:hypothetical protein
VFRVFFVVWVRVVCCERTFQFQGSMWAPSAGMLLGEGDPVRCFIPSGNAPFFVFVCCFLFGGGLAFSAQLLASIARCL